MKLALPTSNRGLNDGYSNFGTRTAFDQNAVYQWLSEQHLVGATVIFVGKVR